MKGIIQNRKECIVCGSWTCEEHLIFHDDEHKKLSEEYGLKVWLCKNHMKGHHGVFGRSGRKLDSELKELGQKAFEWQHIREEFIEKFGRNYL